MKRLWMVVGLLVGMVSSGLAQTINQQVSNSGSYINGQATMGDSRMSTHTLTVKSRFVNVTTGSATAWVTRSVRGSTVSQTISMYRSAGTYRMETNYNIYCPQGLLNANFSKATGFTIGYSFNCLYKIPNTTAISYDQNGNPYYVAKYDLVPGCNVSCQVPRQSTWTTPYYKGKADDNIQVRYWWLNVGGYWQTCLDYFEFSRNSCYQGNCGEFTQ